MRRRYRLQLCCTGMLHAGTGRIQPRGAGGGGGGVNVEQREMIFLNHFCFNNIFHVSFFL